MTFLETRLHYRKNFFTRNELNRFNIELKDIILAYTGASKNI